jgi:hypothetical protein
MSVSSLDPVPREHPARGTGSNAETPWTAPPADSSALGQAVARATRPHYFGWLTHNHRRRHSACDGLSPLNYERSTARALQVQAA